MYIIIIRPVVKNNANFDIYLLQRKFKLNCTQINCKYIYAYNIKQKNVYLNSKMNAYFFKSNYNYK